MGYFGIAVLGIFVFCVSAICITSKYSFRNPFAKKKQGDSKVC